MTVIEMIYEFEQLIETMSDVLKSSERPDTETIIKFLNIAQERYLKETYLDRVAVAGNHEEAVKKLDDLRQLFKISAAIAVDGTPYVLEHGVTLDLPTDYLFYIRSDSEIARTAQPVVSSATYSTNRLGDYYELDKILTTPYNIPLINKPVVFFQETDKMIVIHDKYTTITNVMLTYLRQPDTLVVGKTPGTGETLTCELASQTHRDIVRQAVEIFVVEYKTRLRSATTEQG